MTHHQPHQTPSQQPARPAQRRSQRLLAKKLAGIAAVLCVGLVSTLAVVASTATSVQAQRSTSTVIFRNPTPAGVGSDAQTNVNLALTPSGCSGVSPVAATLQRINSNPNDSGAHFITQIMDARCNWRVTFAPGNGDCAISAQPTFYEGGGKTNLGPASTSGQLTLYGTSVLSERSFQTERIITYSAATGFFRNQEVHEVEFTVSNCDQPSEAVPKITFRNITAAGVGSENQTTVNLTFTPSACPDRLARQQAFSATITRINANSNQPLAHATTQALDYACTWTVSYAAAEAGCEIAAQPAYYEGGEKISIGPADTDGSLRLTGHSALDERSGDTVNFLVHGDAPGLFARRQVQEVDFTVSNCPPDPTEPRLVPVVFKNTTETSQVPDNKLAVRNDSTPVPDSCNEGVVLPNELSTPYVERTNISRSYLDARCSWDVSFAHTTYGCEVTAQVRGGEAGLVLGSVQATEPSLRGTIRLDKDDAKGLTYEGEAVTQIDLAVVGSCLLPDPASLPVIDLRASSDTGISDSDNITGDNSPAFDLSNLVVGAEITVEAKFIGIGGSKTTITKRFTAQSRTAEVEFSQSGAGGPCNVLTTIYGWTMAADNVTYCAFDSLLERGDWVITVTQAEADRPAVTAELVITFHPTLADQGRQES